ncbi:MAG: HD domain-containing protein [Nanoarchaeota archaeon]|nr:HD domain-containing protein [Nanoarchaeota archaeon]
MKVWNLFPSKADDKSDIYCTNKWIFSNRLNPMIDVTNSLCEKYGADKNICELACLLHDTGLVYIKTTIKRKTLNA